MILSAFLPAAIKTSRGWELRVLYLNLQIDWGMSIGTVTLLLTGRVVLPLTFLASLKLRTAVSLLEQSEQIKWAKRGKQRAVSYGLKSDLRKMPQTELLL